MQDSNEVYGVEDDEEPIPMQFCPFIANATLSCVHFVYVSPVRVNIGTNYTHILSGCLLASPRVDAIQIL